MQIKSWTMEILVPEISPILASEIMKPCRYNMSMAVQYLTGHNFLLHQEKKMVTGEERKRFLNSKCRLCSREEESTEHIIYICDALASTPSGNDSEGVPNAVTSDLIS